MASASDFVKDTLDVLANLRLGKVPGLEPQGLGVRFFENAHCLRTLITLITLDQLGLELERCHWLEILPYALQ